MELIETRLAGCFELLPRVIGDARGRFVKTFHRDVFAEHSLRSDWAEEYHSFSEQGVVRGLHFQTPPHEHAKLVYCIQGSATDVILDLRADQPTYGEHIAVELDGDRSNGVYIPAGCAHGFATPRSSCTLVYKVTSVYAPENDTGVRWDSAGVDWPIAEPVTSERDRSFPAFDEFATPFRGAL